MVNLAKLTLGRFSATLHVGGNCFLRYGNNVVHNMHGKPTLEPPVVQAIRRKDPKVIYTRKNQFYILLYDGQKKVQQVYLHFFELPPPLVTKDLLLKELKKFFRKNGRVGKAPYWLNAEEKALLELIHDERMVSVAVNDNRPLEVLSEAIDGWIRTREGLDNVLAYYGTEGVEDDYGRRWLSLEFETDTEKHPLVKMEFSQAMSLYER